MNCYATFKGPLAEAFLSPKKREGVVTLFNGTEEEKGHIREMLQRFNVICRSISHTKSIDVDSFETYCYDTLEFLKEKFDWMPIPRTLHESFAHAAQEIRKNGGKSLGHLSESPLEVCLQSYYN